MNIVDTKECPTCRKKLVSKRSLRYDPNFDNLVANIFPDRYIIEPNSVSWIFKLWVYCFLIIFGPEILFKRSTDSFYLFLLREEYEEEQQKALAIASKKHSALLMSGISKFPRFLWLSNYVSVVILPMLIQFIRLVFKVSVHHAQKFVGEYWVDLHFAYIMH